MIACRGICAHVGNFSIRNASFEIPVGAHAVLTGPTASGKTTLLEIIAGGIVPDAGEVRIGGADVTDMPPEVRTVGFVPQHGYLFPHLSAQQNIGYGASDRGVVALLAERFGINHLLDRSVTVLSGGERQLVALCRALARRPAVVLLDEPVSALDSHRRNAVLRQFASAQSEFGFTVLHVTHIDADASFANVRLEMADGTVSSASGQLR